VKKVRRAEKLHALRQRALDQALARRAAADADAARAAARADDAAGDVVRAASEADAVADAADLEWRSSYVETLRKRAERERRASEDAAAFAERERLATIEAHRAERVADTLAGNARADIARHEARLERRASDERAARKGGRT